MTASSVATPAARTGSVNAGVGCHVRCIVLEGVGRGAAISALAFGGLGRKRSASTTAFEANGSHLITRFVVETAGIANHGAGGRAPPERSFGCSAVAAHLAARRSGGCTALLRCGLGHLLGHGGLRVRLMELLGQDWEVILLLRWRLAAFAFRSRRVWIEWDLGRRMDFRL